MTTPKAHHMDLAEAAFLLKEIDRNGKPWEAMGMRRNDDLPMTATGPAWVIDVLLWNDAHDWAYTTTITTRQEWLRCENTAANDYRGEPTGTEARQAGDDLFLQVEMPDGSLWRVPARLIAEDRAKYYAAKDRANGSDYDTVFANEVHYALFEDRYELRDWAAGNMNWSDVVDHAIQVKTPPREVDYQEGWMNGERAIVRVDAAGVARAVPDSDDEENSEHADHS